MDNKGKSIWYIAYSYNYKNSSYRSQSNALLIAEDAETAIQLVKESIENASDIKIINVNHRGILTL